MLLGVHCSIAGGFHNAFHESKSLGIDAFQIFTKNQLQWKEKVVSTAERSTFLGSLQYNDIKMVFSHVSYLINLASPDYITRDRSIQALINEVVRCQSLTLPFTILHPGFGKGQSKKHSIKKIAKALKTVLRTAENSRVKILLENTAGQGSGIGSDFEQIRQIMDEVCSPGIGVCFDTCHAFASGYDMRTKSGVEITFGDFDRIVGLQHLYAIHLNDSKGCLGSKLDRHEHIGKGELGLEPFRYIMNNFQHIPKVIETPKEGAMDAVNLKVLRGLIGQL